MAVTFVAIGSRDTAGTTTLAIPYSTGIQSGRLSLLSRVVKPSASTFNVPSGFVNVASYTGGTGSQGTDVGPSHVGIDYRILDGSETGSVTATQGGSPNSATGFMIVYQASAGAGWSITSVGGADATHGTGRTATATTTMALAVGDVIVAICGSDTDATTAFTSPAITAAGITFGTTTERRGAGGGTSGGDVGHMAYEATVTAGAATVAPTLTLSGGPSNCGPVAFVRLRQTSPSVPVPQVIESESAQFPTIRRIYPVAQVVESEASQIVSPVLDAQNIDVDWRAGDLSRFTQKVFTEQSAAYVATIDDDLHNLEVRATAGAAHQNNQRDAFILNETSGWQDGIIHAPWGTRSFFDLAEFTFPEGAVIPQHGFVYRYQESGGKRRAIIVWSNIVFSANWIVHAGVWTSNLDGTGFDNRQYGLEMTGLRRTWTVSGSERAGNVVTLTIDDLDPMPQVNDPIYVNVATASFDSWVFIEDVTATTVSYTQTGANESGGAGTIQHVFPYEVEARIHDNFVDVRAWPPENPSVKPEWTNVDTSAGLQLPGAAGDFMWAADAAAFDITGDLTMWADFTPSAFPPSSQSSLFSKYTTSNPSNQRSYRMGLNTSGRPFVNLSSAGTAANVTLTADATPTLTNGRVCLWALVDVVDGANISCTFYQAPTLGQKATRTQLGTKRTQAGSITLFAGTAPLEIGAVNNGALERFTGRIHAAGVRPGLDTGAFQAPVADFEGGVTTNADTTVEDRQFVDWTVAGAASIVNEGVPATGYGFSVDLDKVGTDQQRIDTAAPVGTGEIGVLTAHLGTSSNSLAAIGPVFARNSVQNFITDVVDAVVETETAQAVGRSATVTPAVVATALTAPAAGVSVGAGPAVTARAFTLPTTGASVAAGPSVTATSVAVGSPSESVGAGPAAIGVQLALLASGESVGAGPAVVAGQFSVPSPGESVAAAPAVVSAAVTVPQPGESVSTSPNSINGAFAVPQATISADFAVSPAVIATTPTVPQTGVEVGAGPARVAVAFALPAAAVSVGVAATPTVIAATAGVPQPAVSVTAGASVFSAAVTVPQTGESISASPGAINSQVTLPASAQSVAAAPATISTATAVPQTGASVGASPDSIATSVAVPQATAAADFTVSPAVIATTTTVPQVAPHVGASPVTVAAAAAIPQPAVTVSASPAVVAATTAVPQPDVNVTAGATTVATVVSLPQAAAVTTGSATVELATIAATASVPSVAVNIAAGPVAIVATSTVPSTSAHVITSPAVVVASVAVPAPEINTTISPSTIAASITVPGSTVSVAAQSGTVATAITIIRPSVNVVAAPGAFATAISIPLPVTGAAATVAPTVTAAQISVPQPASNIVAGPSAFATVVSVPQVAIGATLTVTVVAGQIAIPQPGAAIGAGPATVTATVGVPGVTAGGPAAEVPGHEVTIPDGRYHVRVDSGDHTVTLKRQQYDVLLGS